MRLPLFVCASAVILLGWLVMAFSYQVPSQHYQKSDRFAAPVVTKDQAGSQSRDVGAQPRVFPISSSH